MKNFKISTFFPDMSPPAAPLFLVTFIIYLFNNLVIYLFIYLFIYLLTYLFIY